MGGYKPKAIAGEHRAWLLERIKERDFTLRGLVAELAERSRLFAGARRIERRFYGRELPGS
jgi:transposase